MNRIVNKKNDELGREKLHYKNFHIKNLSLEIYLETFDITESFLDGLFSCVPE